MSRVQGKWYRFSLRELILATLVVGLSLAVFLATNRPTFTTSKFFSGKDFSRLINESAATLQRDVEVRFSGASMSTSPGTASADYEFYLAIIPRSTDASRFFSEFVHRLNRELDECDCYVSGRGSIGGRTNHLHYGYHGGAGVAHVSILPSDERSNEVLVKVTIIEVAIGD